MSRGLGGYVVKRRMRGGGIRKRLQRNWVWESQAIQQAPPPVEKIEAAYDLLKKCQEPSGSLRWSVLRVYKQKLTQEKRNAALLAWDEALNNSMLAKRRRVVETQNEKQDKQITITTKSIKTNNKTKQTNKQTSEAPGCSAGSPTRDVGITRLPTIVSTTIGHSIEPAIAIIANV